MDARDGNGQRLNIGVFTETLRPLHGTHVFVMGFARYAAELGHRIRIFAPTEDEDECGGPSRENGGVTICRFTSIRTSFFGQPDYHMAVPFNLFKIVPCKFHIVHAHAYPGPLSLLALAVATVTRKPLFYTYAVHVEEFSKDIPLVGRHQWFRNLCTWLAKLFCNRCNLVIAPSEAIRRKLLAYGVKSRIEVLPMGVDPFFVRGDRRARAPSSAGPFRLLYVGRLSTEKNVNFLLRAFHRLKQRLPAAELTVTGVGPRHKELGALAGKLGIEASVAFTGYQPWERLRDIYRRSHLFWFASTGDTQGLAILEAKASALPCVIMEGPGTSEMVADGSDGFVLPWSRGDAEDCFVARSVELLRAPDKWRSFSEAAAATGAYTSRDSSERLLGLYEEAARRHRRPHVRS